MELTVKITDLAEMQQFGAFLSTLSQGISEASKSEIPTVAIKKTPPVITEKPALEKEPPATVAPEPEVPKTATKTTLAEVRQLAAIKARGDGKRQAVKDLLTSYGASNITELDASHYDDFMVKIQAL